MHRLLSLSFFLLASFYVNVKWFFGKKKIDRAKGVFSDPTMDFEIELEISVGVHTAQGIRVEKSRLVSLVLCMLWGWK